MGIDIGTYESRGMLIGEDFRVTAEHTMAHGMSHPRQGGLNMMQIRCVGGFLRDIQTPD